MQEIEGEGSYFDLPKEAFFNSDPRSKEIRDICVSGFRALNGLTKDLGEVQNADLFREFQEAKERLREFGLYPNIHADESNIDLMRNRIDMAEKLAGQLMRFDIQIDPSGLELMTLIEYTSEEEGITRESYENSREFVFTLIREGFDIKEEDDRF